MILDMQSIANGYIPQHKLKKNFLEYYAEFVQKNSRKGNRHLASSLSVFKKFLGKDYISPIDITENLCERFRNYLLDSFNGETPADYFSRFKKVLKTARKEGYFREDPAEDVKAKAHPSGKKEILGIDDYKLLLNAYCSNYEVGKSV